MFHLIYRFVAAFIFLCISALIAYHSENLAHAGAALLALLTATVYQFVFGCVLLNKWLAGEEIL